MNKHVVLNHKDHLDLKIINDYVEKYEVAANSTMVFTTEFRDVQSEYPIFFRKNNDTGEFYAAALFGLEPEENLFLSDQGWDASYVPMMIRKQPFYIGLKDGEKNEDANSLVVTMDPDSPRVSQSSGESLFNPDGSATEFLNEKMEVLERVHQGYEHTRGFVHALSEHGLLEQFVLELNLQDGSTKQMLGFYTVNEERVQSLSGDTLAEFSSKGYLMPLFMILASNSKVRELIKRKVGV